MNYISLTEAAARCDYSQEYLSLRARQGKLKAVKQGRNWVTTHGWLMDYLHQVDQTRREMQMGVPVISEPVSAVQQPVASAPVTYRDRLDTADKVREEARFQPVVPRSWLDDSDEEQPPAAFLNQDSFWANPTPAVSMQSAVAATPETQASDVSIAIPVTHYEEREEPTAIPSSTDTVVTGEISEAIDQAVQQPALSFSWVRPLVFAGFAIALAIEVGLLAKPILASVNRNNTTVAVTSSTSNIHAGHVAGASVEKTSDTSGTGPTVMQKMAAGLRIVLDDPYDGQTTPAGEWLTNKFNLPVE